MVDASSKFVVNVSNTENSSPSSVYEHSVLDLLELQEVPFSVDVARLQELAPDLVLCELRDSRPVLASVSELAEDNIVKPGLLIDYSEDQEVTYSLS